MAAIPNRPECQGALSNHGLKPQRDAHMAAALKVFKRVAKACQNVDPVKG